MSCDFARTISDSSPMSYTYPDTLTTLRLSRVMIFRHFLNVLHAGIVFPRPITFTFQTDPVNHDQKANGLTTLSRYINISANLSLLKEELIQQKSPASIKTRQNVKLQLHYETTKVLRLFRESFHSASIFASTSFFLTID